MSVLENVAIGAHLRGRHGTLRGDAARSTARRRRGCWPRRRARSSASGWPSTCTTPPAACRSGKQRLVEIARALSADPVLLLLDEPAAGLRYAEKQALAALLRRLRAEGMSILLVEHDMEFVMGLVDRLVVMDFGEKLAEGPPAEIQARSGGDGSLSRRRRMRRSLEVQRPARRSTARSKACIAPACTSRKARSSP